MTNSLGVIYSMLFQRRATLRLEHGAIRFSAPEGALGDTDRCLLRENKPKLTRYLEARAAPKFTIRPAVETAQIKPTMLQDVWRRLCLRSNDSILHTTIRILVPASNATEEAALEIMRILISRHDALRFRFSEFDSGETASFNAPEEFFLDPAVYAISLEGLDRQIKLALAGEVDVLEPWLIRAKLICGYGGRNALVILIHHAICDGYSAALIRRDLMTLIRGEKLANSLRIPFVDTIQSEQAWVQNEAFTPLAKFWRLWGAEIPSFVVQPANRVLTSQPGTVISFAVQPARREVEGLFRASKQASGFRAILGLFALTLSDWAGIKRFSIRSMRNMRTNGALAETVGLLMRHDYIDIDLPSKIAFPDAVNLISEDLTCAMAVNIPTGVYGDSLDFDKLGYKVAPIINYIPLRSLPFGSSEEGDGDLASRPRIIDARDYTIPAAPIFFRVRHAVPFGVSAQMDINSAVIPEEEGRQLVERLMFNLRRFSASSSV